MHLRPYQLEANAAISRAWSEATNDVLLVAATGAGKTNMFLRLLVDELTAHPERRALILAHRRELIDQPLQRIGSIAPDWLEASFAPRVGIVMAERNEPSCQITIATVQSLTGRSAAAKAAGRWPRIEALLAHGLIDYLVIDEAHHATADSYLTIWRQLREANPNLRNLGVTATPIRADGEGLSTVYEHVAARITIADLVKLHYLVQPRWLAIDTGISLKGVGSSGGDYSPGDLAKRFDTPRGRRIIVESYQQYAAGRRSIAFTASVEGAHDLAEAFQLAGVKAAAIDANTPKAERAQLVNGFRSGAITILCNVDVLTEGFDAPGASCVLMCRPTKSDGRYIQCMGRGLRPVNGIAEPGEDCIILDFLPEDVRNIVMAGDVLGVPKAQSDALRTMIEEREENEDGELSQLGFTFDGERLDYGGTPLEIVARQLDYLNASRWQWDRRDGWMTLGLGPGDDGIERSLAIVPCEGGHVLYGMARKPIGEDERGKMRYGSWQRVLCQQGQLDELCALAESKADRYAVQTLAAKGRSWHKGLASEPQINYLRRLVPKEHRKAVHGGLSKIEAAALINYWQIRNVLSDQAHS